MHLASKKAVFLEKSVGNRHANDQTRRVGRKLVVSETGSVTRLLETAESPQSPDDVLCFSRSSLVVRLLPSSSETDVKRA
jgi:hypothetical protein